METISARLDEEILKDFENVLKQNRSKVVRELVDAGRKHKAVDLYRNRKVSLGLGAKLAGVTLSEFMDLLKDHNVYLNIELEDVKESMTNLKKIW